MSRVLTKEKTCTAIIFQPIFFLYFSLGEEAKKPIKLVIFELHFNKGSSLIATNTYTHKEKDEYAINPLGGQ